MPTRTLSSFEFNGTLVSYDLDDLSSRVGLSLLPVSLKDKAFPHRVTFAQEAKSPNSPHLVIDPLAHISLLGSPNAGPFANGRTMRRSPDTDALKYESQKIEKLSDDIGPKTVITTLLKHPAGHTVTHQLTWYDHEKAGHVVTSFTNGSASTVKLGLLTSFAMGGISPFASDDAPERMRAHRFRSNWSAEGRHETHLLEEMHLERSWSGSSPNVERFGQVGSMPVRIYFPFVAVEDTHTQVFWGAQLHWAASWQMQIGHRDDQVTLDGGLADREFGHWYKNIAPGETFSAPKAVIACATGTIDDLCDALTQTQQSPLRTLPPVEKDLPITFNEWCTTWGLPTHDSMIALADRLQNTGVRYLVMDAGWYRPDTGSWNEAQGDWIANPKAFPQGLAATSAAIRQRGLIPGIWFEIEVCGSDSAAFNQTDLLLHLDGQPLTVGTRRFWDLNNPRTIDYLTTRVIDLLEKNDFGYLKVDYNDAIGIGVDGSESPGEGLRRQTQGVYQWYQLMRRRLPNLVIEICSSGGHRHEPSMLAFAAQACFSDSHECLEIPIIAANLHRLMLPRQSQVWAVLRAPDSIDRLIYSLSALFLGRMCLSGDICQLAPDQWNLVQRAINLYQKITPIIGGVGAVSRRQGEFGPSWRHPHGWQAVVRTYNHQALVVVHTFANHQGSVTIQLPPGTWQISDTLNSLSTPPAVVANTLQLPNMHQFQAAVIVLNQISPRT